MDENITERINRGITFLDEVRPNWRQVLLGADALGDFDFADPDSCVLGLNFDYVPGQHTKFGHGTAVLCEYEDENHLAFDEDDDPESFDCRISYGFDGASDEYAALHDAWLEAARA